MRFICISDTHGLHASMPDLPDADGIIHAGDFTNFGRMDQCIKALGWFNSLPYKHRIIIAGNHDLFMDPDHPDQSSSISAINAILPVSEGFHYLWNSGCDIEGLKFWGSPQTPVFFNWAFNLPHGEPLRKHWNQIPTNTDILITHGPIHGVLDRAPSLLNSSKLISVGDVALARRVQVIKPSVHVCGHIHCSYGVEKCNDTLHINASICTESYQPTNKPFIFDIDPITKESSLIPTL